MTYSNVKLQAAGACSCDIPFGDSTKNASKVVHRIFPTPFSFVVPTDLPGLKPCPSFYVVSIGLPPLVLIPYIPFYVVVLRGLPELTPYSLSLVVPLGRSYPSLGYIHTHNAFVQHAHYATLWTSVAIYLHTLHYMYTANKCGYIPTYSTLHVYCKQANLTNFISLVSTVVYNIAILMISCV